MRNFGRGMWRRVGDFEKPHAPQINKHNQIQEYLALMQYLKQRQYNFNTYHQQLSANINETLIVSSKNVIEEPVIEESIIEESVIEEPVIEEPVIEKVCLLELPNIIPKKRKKKKKRENK